MVKNMNKEYRCDIDYKIIYLQYNASNAEKKMGEERMNELAAQGYKIHSQNHGIVIMMKETYSEVTEPPPPIFSDGTFYGFKVIINEYTSQYCKGSIYIPNSTYTYKEIEGITGSFANYLADTYHVKAQVIARRDDVSEFSICCIEAFPEEKKS